MKFTVSQLRERLQEAGLKVTPQRLAILEAVLELEGHPTADNIIDYIRKTHPSIASGTVYKVLDVLVDNDLIYRVKTEKDVMRYDGVMDRHHHLYAVNTDRIEDYSDEDLDRLLQEYFKKNNIPGFTIEDIKLQIKGRFT